MTRLILPLILLAAAGGLFSLYTNQEYQVVKELQAEVESYDVALTKSKELRAKRDELLAKKRAFVEEDMDKLKTILPDNVDNIRLVIDINNIASRHSLTLTDVQLGEVSDTSDSRNPTAVGVSTSPVGSVELGFSLTATYEDMLAFLADVEHNLRVIDTEKINFEVSLTTPGSNAYDFTIRTYWLH